MWIFVQLDRSTAQSVTKRTDECCSCLNKHRLSVAEGSLSLSGLNQKYICPAVLSPSAHTNIINYRWNPDLIDNMKITLKSTFNIFDPEFHPIFTI